jgi:DNA-binding helix-hairpin-helix protein with protein kinase domain
MGRHPFAGRYSGRGDMPIELAISEFRYAYGREAASKQMAPPPNILGVNTLSYRLNLLFERAFNEQSVQSPRPTAKEWIQELDALKSSLKMCGQNPAHKYFGQLGSCPWCSLENSSGVIYFIAPTSTVPTAIFDVNQIWARIQAIQPIAIGAFPLSIPLNAVKPTPLPQNDRGFWAIFNFFLGEPEQEERNRRMQVVGERRMEWQHLQNTWHQTKWNESFFAKKRLLEKYRKEWDRSNLAYEQEKNSIALTIYLEGFFVEDACIPGIGEGLTMKLKAWGIETAADITESEVKSVPGFGEKRTQDLVDWRYSIERQFRQKPILVKSTPQLDQKYRQSRLKLEKQLSGGVEELEQIKRQIKQKQEQFLQQCRQVALKLAQAEADASI